MQKKPLGPETQLCGLPSYLWQAIFPEPYTVTQYILFGQPTKILYCHNRDHLLKSKIAYFDINRVRNSNITSPLKERKSSYSRSAFIIDLS